MWEIVSFGAEVWKEHKEWLVGVPGVLACIWGCVPESVRKVPGFLLSLLWVLLCLVFVRRPAPPNVYFDNTLANLKEKAELLDHSDDTLAFGTTHYKKGKVTALGVAGDETSRRPVKLNWSQWRQIRRAYFDRLRQQLKEREANFLTSAAAGQALRDPKKIANT